MAVTRFVMVTCLLCLEVRTACICVTTNDYLPFLLSPFSYRSDNLRKYFEEANGDYGGH